MAVTKGGSIVEVGTQIATFAVGESCSMGRAFVRGCMVEDLER